VTVARSTDASSAEYPSAVENKSASLITALPWLSETSGAAVNMYSVTTGAYAGMNTSSSANKFIFKGNGLYESTHKGAFGMVGSMQFYSQKYDGNVKVGNWEVTLTKQFEGKTKVYWTQFEAVRGGRVLHLTNKEYSGDRFHLVKTN
jgi:hypothetical protein